MVIVSIRHCLFAIHIKSKLFDLLLIALFIDYLLRWLSNTILDLSKIDEPTLL